MKRVISILLLVLILMNLSSNITYAVSNSYPHDYRYWSQGGSGYPRVKKYGCYIVAISKMIVESGVDTSSSFNPDVFAKWEEDNGYITDLDTSIGQNSMYAPDKYAETKGKKLKYEDTKSYSDSTLWNYINNGYYCIVHIKYVSNGENAHHYVFVSNEDSKNNNTLMFYESWSGESSVGVKSKSALLGTYSNSHISEIYVYKGSNSNYIPPDTEAPTISFVGTENVSSNAFTILCKLNDNVGVTKVSFVLYSHNGNEYKFSREASNGTCRFTIDTKDYGGAGTFSAHIYAYDAANNVSEYARTGEINAISNYTITYDANGGTGAPSPQSKSHGQTIQLSTQWPSRPGYAFWGWATSPDGVAVYPSGGTYTADSSITLYACWKPADSTITYDANGGTGAPSPQSKSHGQTIQLSTQWPSRPGYIFWGWATSPDGVAVYPSGGTYSAEGDVTLYAYWKPNLNLVANKNKISTGESITFNYDFSHSSSVWFCIDKDGTDFLQSYINYPTTYTTSFDKPGNYSVTICAYVGAEYFATNVVYFSVYGTESLVAKSGNTHTIKTTMYDITTHCDIIIAGYKGGKFVTLESVPYTQDTLTTTLTGDIDEIKIMAWNSLSGLSSLCNAEVIPQSEFIIE